MSDIPNFRGERGRCAECHCESDDLTLLGKRDLCTRCYRIAIADLRLRETDYPTRQDASGAWER